jgi:hypothetical protein
MATDDVRTHDSTTHGDAQAETAATEHGADQATE